MLRLKALREEKGISQQKLAIDLNVSQASISKYENGTAEPDISMLFAMADYFHVSIDYLVGKTKQRNYFIQKPEEELESEILSYYRRLLPHQKEKVKMYLLGLLDL